MASSHKPEELIELFKLERVINQGNIYQFKCELHELTVLLDQNGRRVTLLGKIEDKEAILTAERAAFPNDEKTIRAFHAALTGINNLGDNDIYRWYLASSGTLEGAPSDLKLNLIWPCTEKHIKKYSPQEVRMVTETPEIYAQHVRPYMQRMRDEGRLNWVFNILDGKAEQEDVLLRDTGTSKDGQDEGFLLAPDLNWDRKTLTSLHLLAMPSRRDFWSLRDLKKCHVDWLRDMRAKILSATTKVYKDLEKDQIKLYIHYQPTYYHFHIHVVHVMAEATSTQAVGKALGLENVIAQLESMAGGSDAGMADVTLTYYLGTAHDLWNDVFLPLKEARIG